MKNIALKGIKRRIIENIWIILEIIVAMVIIGTTFWLIGKKEKVELPTISSDLRIVLKGNSIINLNVGDNYFEQGAIAYDTYDGYLSNLVVINGKVDTSKIGEYIIKYSVRNSLGEKKTIERKIIVTKKNKMVNDLKITIYANSFERNDSTIISVSIEGSGYAYTIIENKKFYDNNFDYMVNKNGIFTIKVFDVSGNHTSKRVKISNIDIS